MFRKIKIVPKPWGQEQYLILTKKYALKILEIKGGHRFSLQYHKKKMESWYVLSGKIQVTLGKKSFVAQVGQVLHVPPKTIHRIKGLAKWNQIVEVSTPELSDVVRLEDDYNREGTSAP
jgi:mannose-6-phosphate isomerase